MASIYRRGKTWWVHYLVGGKSIARSLKTDNERVALDKKKRLEGLEATDQLSCPSNTPIEPFLQSFCEFLQATRTRKGARNDMSNLRQFFGPCCDALKLGSRVPHKFRDQVAHLPVVPDAFTKRHVPIKRLEQLSGEMISTYIQDRIVEDGIAAKTANRTREVLYRTFSYASERHGYMCPDRRYRNPVEAVRRMKEPAPVITWLTQEQIKEQLKVLEGHSTIRAMVAMYIYAGLRREEALWLMPADVDLKTCMIQVCAKKIDGEFWQPKTKKNRSVPISQALQAALKEYLPKADSTWFFPGPTGGRWNVDNFSQDLRAINAAAGLTWSCLIYRHTFGSHLAQKGVSLYKIAEMMGNSPEICRRHYAAMIPEAMRDAVEFGDPSVSRPDSPIDKTLVEVLLEKLAKLDGLVGDEPKLKLAVGH